MWLKKNVVKANVFKYPNSSYLATKNYIKTRKQKIVPWFPKMQIEKDRLTVTVDSHILCFHTFS
jgi:hypothetical protein